VHLLYKLAISFEISIKSNATISLLVEHRTRSRVRVLAMAGHHRDLALRKLFTPVCLCHQAVWFGTGQEAVMLFGWEGNRGPGAVAACHWVYD